MPEQNESKSVIITKKGGVKKYEYNNCANFTWRVAE